MQALPECTIEQTHDKHMVEQYYSDNCYLVGTHEVNQDQVDMLKSNLRKNKSPGLDGITAEDLIYGKSSLLFSLLASLYTVILSIGICTYIIHHWFNCSHTKEIYT